MERIMGESALPGDVRTDVVDEIVDQREQPDDH
jgi:hypothetical protein